MLDEDTMFSWRRESQLMKDESFIPNYQVFAIFKNRFFRVLLQPLPHVSAKLVYTK